MNYEIVHTEEFSRHIKQLSKKHPSLKNDYAAFLISLQTNPLRVNAPGKNCYKVRLKITSKKTGKSGGARIITYVRIELKRIVLPDIYDKADKDSLSDKELFALIKKVE